MMKCANPTANMNVNTEFTDNEPRLSGSESDSIQLGSDLSGLSTLELGGLISSKMAL